MKIRSLPLHHLGYQLYLALQHLGYQLISAADLGLLKNIIDMPLDSIFRNAQLICNIRIAHACAY